MVQRSIAGDQLVEELDRLAVQRGQRQLRRQSQQR
jgi:hypothetical protein